MTRTTLALLLLLTAALFGACTDDAAPDATAVLETKIDEPAAPLPPLGVEAGPPQLVTETYLRRQLDLATAQLWSRVIAEMLVGPVHKSPSYLRFWFSAPTWDKDKTVQVGWVENQGSGIQASYHFSIVFGSPNYDSGAGGVSTGSCHRLPGAGVATTGEFTTVANHTGEPVTHHIEKTVTETTASSISLTQSLELSSGTTLEAGTDVAKASATFSATFGISKTATEDHSTETSVTVSDDLDVDAGHTVAIAFSTDDSATDCTVSINAAADWSSIQVYINQGAGWFGNDTPLVPPKTNWAAAHAKSPTARSNLGLLLQGDVIQNPSSNTPVMEFTQADDIYRLAMGYDVRCPACKHLLLSEYAKAALAKMSDPNSRWISFEGLRHSTSKADASYTATDVTGQDPACVSGELGKVGAPVASLDANGNGLLDACE